MKLKIKKYQQGGAVASPTPSWLTNFNTKFVPDVPKNTQDNLFYNGTYNWQQGARHTVINTNPVYNTSALVQAQIANLKSNKLTPDQINNNQDIHANWHYNYTGLQGTNYPKYDQNVQNYQNNYNKLGLNQIVLQGNTFQDVASQLHRKINAPHDSAKSGYNPDGLYGAETDMRTYLPRLSDYWNGKEYDKTKLNQDINAFKTVGYDYYPDQKTGYMKIKPIVTNATTTPINNITGNTSILSQQFKQKKQSSPWLSNLIQNPELQAGILGASRVIADNYNNTNILNKYLSKIQAPLKESQEFDRNIYGDYAGQQQYNEQANQLESEARKPMTSDASLQLAGQLEAVNQGNKYREQGDLLNNQTIEKTREATLAQEKENAYNRVQTANENNALTQQVNQFKAGLQRDQKLKNIQNWDTYLSQIESGLINKSADKYNQKQQLQDTYNKYIEESLIPTDAYQNAVNQLNSSNAKYGTPEYNLAVANIQKEEKKIAAARAYLSAKRSNINVNTPEWKAYLNNSGLDDNYISRLNNGPQNIQGNKWNPGGSTPGTLKQGYYKLGGVVELQLPVFQQGGEVPLVSYTPFQQPTVSKQQVNQDTSTKQDTKSDKNELTEKDIADTLKGIDGLPNDVNVLSDQLHKFLDLQQYSLSGDSTTQAYHQYINALTTVNKVKQSAIEYKNAYDQVKGNEGLNELAVTDTGNVIALDKQGSLHSLTPQQYLNNKDSYQALTNAQLLYERANDPKLAEQNQLFTTISNGIGINKIKDMIDKIVGKIGTSTMSADNYTYKFNNIQAGIDQLRSLAKAGYLDKDTASVMLSLNGLYQTNSELSSQAKQAKMAVTAVLESLPVNARTILTLRAGSVDGAADLVAKMIYSNVTDSQKFTIKQREDLDPTTGLPYVGGKGEGKGKGSDEGDDTKTKLSTPQEWALGYGQKSTFQIQGNGNQAITVTGNIMPITDGSNKSIGVTTLNDVSTGGYAGALDLNHATMGKGLRLNILGQGNVVIDGTRLYRVDLPVNPNNRNQPWFDLLDKKSLADAQVRKQHAVGGRIIDPDKNANQLSNGEKIIINKIYQRYGLPAKFDSAGNENTLQYRKFGLVEGNALQSSFVQNTNFDKINGWLEELTDESQRKNFETIVKKNNSSFHLSNGVLGGFFGSGDKIYHGTIFIPVSDNYFNYGASSGSEFMPTAAQSLQTEQRIQQTQRIQSLVDAGARPKIGIKSSYSQ